MVPVLENRVLTIFSDGKPLLDDAISQISSNSSLHGRSPVSSPAQSRQFLPLIQTQGPILVPGLDSFSSSPATDVHEAYVDPEDLRISRQDTESKIGNDIPRIIIPVSGDKIIPSAASMEVEGRGSALECHSESNSSEGPIRRFTK